MIILVVMLTLADCMITPPVLLASVVTCRLADQSRRVASAGMPSMNVIYQNFVLATLSFVHLMCSRLMGYPVKLANLSVIKDHAGLILISVDYCGDLQAKNRTTSVTSTTVWAPAMETADTTG